MSFILETIGEDDHSEIKARFDAYYDYLRKVRDSLPTTAYEFAAADWHYDPTDHRALHDSWVESLLISETQAEEDRSRRIVSIGIRLLGAYHDGHIELAYTDVQDYQINAPIKKPGSHGDWLIDEIRLSERNSVLHEIVFSNGGHWIIECRNISYKWIPLETIP